MVKMDTPTVTEGLNDTSTQTHTDDEETRIKLTLEHRAKRYTCDRCTAIPWRDFLDFNRIASDASQHIVFSKSWSQLRTHKCRVCALLWRISAHTEVQTLQCDKPEHGSKFIGKLRFYSEGKRNYQNAYLGILGNPETSLPLLYLDQEYINYDLISQWIKICDASHGKTCLAKFTGTLTNFQVIDCLNRIVQVAPEGCAYVALSYVWGLPSNEENTTFQSLDKELPKTIEDAITVTQRLGYRYLWIDRYCIDQNDAKEKHTQIRQMGTIYASAQLTLMASFGENPSFGFPGVSSPRKVYVPKVEHIGSIDLVYTGVNIPKKIYKSTWAARAWTLQESFLSRRRLFFTKYAILFVCGKRVYSDLAKDFTLGRSEFVSQLDWMMPRRSTDAGMPFRSHDKMSDKLLIASNYMTAYSERRLSYDSDAMNAILGIMSYVSCFNNIPTGIYFIWGVAFGCLGDKNYISIAIDWYHFGGPARRRHGIPSWSSVGWEGQTDGKMRYMTENQEMSLGLQCQDGSKTLIEYAQSGQAFEHLGIETAPSRLEIRGASTFPIRVTRSHGDIRAVVSLKSGIDAHLYVYWDEEVHGSDIHKMTWIGLAISEKSAMVLKSREEEENVYQRAGFITPRNAHRINVENFIFYDSKTGELITSLERRNDCMELLNQYMLESRSDIILV